MAKKSAMKQSVIYLFFLDNKRKIFKSNLVLEVVFVPESEGLYYLAVADSGKPPPPPYFKTETRRAEKKSFGDQALLPL